MLNKTGMALRLVAGSFLAGLIGCISNPMPPATLLETFTPEIGAVVKAELGDTLLRHVVGATRPSYMVTVPAADPDTHPHAWPAGTVLKPFQITNNYEGYLGRGGGNPLCRNIETGQWCGGHLITGCETVACLMEPLGNLEVVPAPWVDPDQMNLDQKFIYNGRVGDNLKFTYREFTVAGYARDAFTQDVQYDLKEDPIIGFKGARVEVIEATNREITYKVISYFSD